MGKQETGNTIFKYWLKKWTTKKQTDWKEYKIKRISLEKYDWKWMKNERLWNSYKKYSRILWINMVENDENWLYNADKK